MELRTHSQHVDVDASAQVHNHQFTVKVDKKIFHLLSSPYKYTIQACVRELSTNAKDAHVAAGNPGAFILTAPTPDHPFFVVEDFGTGMTLEMIHNMTTYGYSSKESGERADEFNGVLGIGCKSPLAYGNSFNVTSYHDGLEHAMVFYKGDGGIPCAAHLLTAPTTRTNGVIIKIPVKASDFETFDACILRTVAAIGFPVIVRKLIKHGDALIAYDSTPERVELVQRRLASGDDSEGVKFGPLTVNVGGAAPLSLALMLNPAGHQNVASASPPQTCKCESIYLNKPAILAHMGGVLYPIDFEALAQFGNRITQERLNVLAALTNMPHIAKIGGHGELDRSGPIKSAYAGYILSVINFDNGELMFAASREELDYSIKHTRDSIVKKVDEIFDYLDRCYASVVDAAPDALSASQAIFQKTIELTYFLSGGHLTHLKTGREFSNHNSHELMWHLHQHLSRVINVSKFGVLPTHYDVDVGWIYDRVEGVKFGSVTSTTSASEPVYHYNSWVNFSVTDNIGNKQKVLKNHISAIGSLSRLGALSEAEYRVITADGIRIPIKGLMNEYIAYVFIDKKSHYNRTLCAQLNKIKRFNNIMFIRGDRPISATQRQQFLKSIGNPSNVFSSNDLMATAPAKKINPEVVSFLKKSRRCVHMPVATADDFNKIAKSRPGVCARKYIITGEDIVASPQEYAVIIYSGTKHYADIKIDGTKIQPAVSCDSHENSSMSQTFGFTKMCLTLANNTGWVSAEKCNVAHTVDAYDSIGINRFAHFTGVRKIIRLSVTDFNTFNKHTGNRLKTVMQCVIDQVISRLDPAQLYVGLRTYSQLKKTLSESYHERKRDGKALSHNSSASELIALYSTGYLIGKIPGQTYLSSYAAIYSAFGQAVEWFLNVLNVVVAEYGHHYRSIQECYSADTIYDALRPAIPTIESRLGPKQIQALELEVDANITEMKSLLRQLCSCDILKYVLSSDSYVEDVARYYSADGFIKIAASTLASLLAVLESPK
jgi:hypothetical protein